MNPRPHGPEQEPETFFNHFGPFLAVSAPFHIFFEPLCPRCFRVVRGGVWYALWSVTLPSPCWCLSPAGTGSVFHASAGLHCTSEGGIQQVLSAPSAAQKLGDCKQKCIPTSWRGLPLIGMRICFLYTNKEVGAAVAVGSGIKTLWDCLWE